MRKSISLRKDEHLEIAIQHDIEGPLTTWFEYVRFVHNALPEVAVEEVDTSVEFLGKKLSAPIMIEAITGGSEKAFEVNKRLAEIARELNIAIEVGSQRPMLIDSTLEDSYKIVRYVASEIPVIANIGGTQLRKISLEDVYRLIEVLEADALSIHLNPVHELVQVEGDRDFKGVIDAICSVAKDLGVPVIVKEVGFGISKEVAERLASCNVYAIDVAGAGGTNWVRIERIRVISEYIEPPTLYVELLDWGLPTAVSIVEARCGAPDKVVIASGGIRKSVEVALSIALGADLVGLARPALLDATCGTRFVHNIVKGLRKVMALLGAKSVKDLVHVPIVIMDKLAQWICARRLRLRNKNAYLYCGASL